MTTTAPSVYEIADILRGAHTAIRCRGWTQTEPPAGCGPVHALTAIGIGVTGWLYDPRTILSLHDEARYEAAIARVSLRLDLHGADDLEAFTAWHDDPARTPDDVLHALQDTARGLEGYRPDRVITPTVRDVTSVHQGVLLTCYGEDSNYMAIGHIAPALMVTAGAECNLHLTGEPLADGWPQGRLERRVWHTWALHWRNPRGEIWWDVDHDRRTPGATPITILPGD
ncbi:DUF6197 family protein [Streptomyces sp. NEAU-174]|uniref:DUF6197 family protein n=1 Tax=Streptomyces sp. NEAU-174 TaxID=3458254 RepID=UPI004043BDD3